MTHLSNREVRTINALAEILVPQGGRFSYGYKDVDFISFFEDFLSNVPFRVKWFLFFNLWIFEYFAWISLLYCSYSDFKIHNQKKKSFFKNVIWYFRTPGIFSKTNPEYREVIILKMRGNRYFAIRGIYMLVSIVMLMSFYSEEKVMNEIKYFGYKDGNNKIINKKSAI